MRSFPALIAAVLLCACGSSPETGERKDAKGTPAAGTPPPAAVPDVPAFATPAAVAPTPASDAQDGAAALRRLAAAGKPILVDGYEEVAAGEFVVDEAGDPSVYAGSYHFGDSEGESTLTLTVRGNAVTGTLGYGVWENETWAGREVRLDGGKIDGATLSAPGWSGVFVRYRGQPGLVILRAPTDVLGGVEFGEKEDAANEESP